MNTRTNMQNAPRSIQLLPSTLRNQIAAGEVVERPASVLKELIENSLDAGASEINIVLEDGGQSLISVRDNGFGIPEAELELALTRHATSKVQSFAELLRVSSFGFRGEALPSIASVAEVRLESVYRPDLQGNLQGQVFAEQEDKGEGQSAPEVLGAFVEMHHGIINASGISSIAKGTLVVVRELFANVPARLKFLKNPSTELKKCQEVVMRMALARQDVSFSLCAGSREIFSLPANTSLLNRLGQIWPEQITSGLVSFAGVRHDIKVSGLASLPQCAQSRGDRLLVYVNGRPVQDKLLLRAVREAYKGRLTSKEYPQVVLFVEIAPEEIDVNVHPAKTEVRFRDERSIFGAVLKTLETAFAGQPSMGFSPVMGLQVQAQGFFPSLGKREDQGWPAEVVQEQGRFLPSSDETSRALGFWGVLDKPRILEFPATKNEDAEGDEYVSAFGGEADLVPALGSAGSEHVPSFGRGASPVAHEENGLYGFANSSINEGKTAWKDAQHPTSAEQLHQGLGQGHGGYPFTIGSLTCFGQISATYLVAMQEDKIILIDQHAAHERVLLHKISSKVTKGQSQLLALPVNISLHKVEKERLEQKDQDLQALGFVLELNLDNVLVHGVPALLPTQTALELLKDIIADKVDGLEEKLHRMSCRTAIKAGQILTADEAAGLLLQWLSTPDYRFCPHGRPVVVELGKNELERMFKRVVG